MPMNLQQESEALLAQVVDLSRDGRFSDAEQILREVLQRRSDFPEARTALAETLYNKCLRTLDDRHLDEYFG
jgi:thioredoxin-like negative regulator of GroEL